MQVIARGAEAEIRRGEWLGRQVIIKKRVPKSYRHPDLDALLRASRTRNEARLIREARRAGVPTPIIYDINLETGELVMQEIRGERVKDALSRDEMVNEICEEIGRLAAMLHSSRITHGDLTTSNMILCDGKIWLIDLSLGTRGATREEMGVDMHLLSEAFLSAHSEILDRYKTVLDSYLRGFPGGVEVLEKVKEIERRGRYT